MNQNDNSIKIIKNKFKPNWVIKWARLAVKRWWNYFIKEININIIWW